MTGPVDLGKARAAIARVRSALDEEGPFSWLTIAGGTVAAASRSLSAAAPFPWGGDVTVAGREFEDVLGRMPADPRFELDGDALVLIAGRTRAEVRLAGAPPALVPQAPDDADALPLDAATLARFEVLAAFVSEDPVPAWMNSLIVQRGRASACGPAAAIFAYASIPDFGADALIPKRALAAVLAAGEKPRRIALYPNRAAFFWDDGGWLASSLVDGKVPGTIDRLAEMAAVAGSLHRLTDEWREAFVRVAGFADAEIVVRADRLSAGKGVAEVVEFVESPVPSGRDHSKWTKALADLVVANAEAWDLSAYPAPSAFSGPVVRGLVTGRN